MIKFLTFTKKASVIILLVLFIQSSAQTTDLLLPKKEFRINLETVMYRKLIETSNSGHSSFNSRNAPSGILSISNYYRLKHNFAIEPSIGFTIIPYNYYFDFDLDTSHFLLFRKSKKFK